MAAASSLMVGNALYSLSSPLSSGPMHPQEVKTELSAEDMERIEKSPMAKELNKYFGQGYSCAESFVLVSLRYLDRPEELVWAAAGFGGGLYHKDLCGFLTGGIMSIGFASGLLKKPRREARELCGESVKKYWEWWKSRAPLHCYEIRTRETTSRVCLNQGLLSAAKIEDLIKPVKKTT